MANPQKNNQRTLWKLRSAWTSTQTELMQLYVLILELMAWYLHAHRDNDQEGQMIGLIWEFEEGMDHFADVLTNKGKFLWEIK